MADTTLADWPSTVKVSTAKILCHTVVLCIPYPDGGKF